jgi:hypothetical protein
MTGARSAAESRPRTMAKLFNNAGDKPILPSSQAADRHGQAGEPWPAPAAEPRASVSVVSPLRSGAAHAAITMAPSIPMCRQAAIVPARCRLFILLSFLRPVASLIYCLVNSTLSCSSGSPR